MLVKTDYMKQSGKGTPMYSRRGAQTIALHKCFRKNDLEKYRRQQEEQEIEQQVPNFKSLEQIKQFMEESQRLHEERLLQERSNSRNNSREKLSYVFKLCDRDNCVSAKLESSKHSNLVDVYRYNPQYNQVMKRTPGVKMRPETQQVRIRKIASTERPARYRGNYKSRNNQMQQYYTQQNESAIVNPQPEEKAEDSPVNHPFRRMPTNISQPLKRMNTQHHESSSSQYQSHQVFKAHNKSEIDDIVSNDYEDTPKDGMQSQNRNVNLNHSCFNQSPQHKQHNYHSLIGTNDYSRTNRTRNLLNKTFTNINTSKRAGISSSERSKCVIDMSRQCGRSQKSIISLKETTKLEFLASHTINQLRQPNKNVQRFDVTKLTAKNKASRSKLQLMKLLGLVPNEDKKVKSVDYVHSVPYSIDPVTQTTIFRNPDSMNGLIGLLNPDIKSIYGLFIKSKESHRDKRCLGTKVLMDDSDPAHKVYEYQWKTFNQVYRETQYLANSIIDHNLFSEIEDPDFGVKLKVAGICSINREEWVVTDLACNLLGITTVPLYETLGADMLTLILNQTEMSTLFGSEKSLTNILMLSSLGTELKYMKQFVCFDHASDNLKKLCSESNIHLLNYHDTINFQRAIGENVTYDHSQADLEAIFTISYTSGTEKNPKGVMLSNANFMSAITNILKAGESCEINHTDTYISYLPLAHVFDRLGVYCSISQGASVGFFGGEILKIVDDLQLLQPTIFTTVPRLLNKVYDKIIQGLNSQPSWKQWLFNRGINSKMYYLHEQGAVQYKLYDKVVFNKAKARLGGKVRLIITASAPISENVLNFLKCVLCVPIIEGYGQTESCGASFATKIYDNEAGHVGGPCVGIEFRLNDVEEMNYTRYSKPYPQGEVCIRGPSIFRGYFKNKTLTDEVVDQEGWLHTGDVGMLGQGNSLKIVDRIKNIFKLSQGEYIVAEKLERVYEQSQYISQIFIHGDSLQNHIVAIIYPEPTMIEEFCKKHGLDHSDLSHMLKLIEVRKLIEGELKLLASENKLNSLEQIRDHFRLVDKEFEVGTILTPTQKLRRPQAREYFKDLIEEMYTQSANANNM